MANYKTIKASDWVTVDAVHELERWTTTDGGVTWDTIAITRGSANKNMLPCVPRNHKPNMQVDVMWLNGVYTSMSPRRIQLRSENIPLQDGRIASDHCRTTGGSNQRSRRGEWCATAPG